MVHFLGRGLILVNFVGRGVNFVTFIERGLLKYFFGKGACFGIFFIKRG